MARKDEMRYCIYLHLIETSKSGDFKGSAFNSYCISFDTLFYVLYSFNRPLIFYRTLTTELLSNCIRPGPADLRYTLPVQTV